MPQSWHGSVVNRQSCWKSFKSIRKSNSHLFKPVIEDCRQTFFLVYIHIKWTNLVSEEDLCLSDSGGIYRTSKPFHKIWIQFSGDDFYWLMLYSLMAVGRSCSTPCRAEGAIVLRSSSGSTVWCNQWELSMMDFNLAKMLLLAISVMEANGYVSSYSCDGSMVLRALEIFLKKQVNDGSIHSNPTSSLSGRSRQMVRTDSLP